MPTNEDGRRVGESLRDRYGAFFGDGKKLRHDAGESDFGRLNLENIPEALRPLVAYAEFWGIPDDGFRVELVELAPAEIFEEFCERVSEYENLLLDWLAGPEAKKEHLTYEYVIFSAMLMAYDYPRANGKNAQRE